MDRILEQQQWPQGRGSAVCVDLLTMAPGPHRRDFEGVPSNSSRFLHKQEVLFHTLYLEVPLFRPKKETVREVPLKLEVLDPNAFSQAPAQCCLQPGTWGDGWAS